MDESGKLYEGQDQEVLLRIIDIALQIAKGPEFYISAVEHPNNDDY